MNGTAALKIALELTGVKENEEVILPALTFVGTANAACYLGAVPHFVDCDAYTLGIDPEALRAWLEAVAEPTGDGY